jgi:hypothetical protein
VLRPTPDVPALATPRPPETIYDVRPTWADRVVGWKPALVLLWLVLHLASFNGQWRPGLDSALYRDLGRALAAGEGYALHGEPHRQAFPGVPMLFAGLETLFGDAAWPGIVAMLLFSAASIVMSYLLLRRVLPDWAATVATAGVAFNWRFFSLGHEHMTDMPFFFGVVTTLYAVERVRDPGRMAKLVGGGLLLVGLVTAATTRPTMWILLTALCIWLVGHAILATRHRRRDVQIAAAVATALAALIVVAFVMLDPRSDANGSFRGGYEQELLQRLSDLPARLVSLPEMVWIVIHDDVPRLFFGERIVVLNVLLVLAMAGGVGLLCFRGDASSTRRRLWVVLAVLLLVVTLVASSEPRYWMMILPILWAGWIVGLAKGARDWFRSAGGRTAWISIGVGVVFVGNAIHIGKFVVEQRSPDFLATYNHGRYLPVRQLADVVQANVASDETVITPFGRVVQYWSGRHVLQRRDLLPFPGAGEADWMLHLAELDVPWMLFPHEAYRHKDRELFRLVRDARIFAANRDPENIIPVGVFTDRVGIDHTWYLAPPGVAFDRLPPREGASE